MASNIIYLSENDVQQVLDWDQLLYVIEENFLDVSSKDSITIQPARGIMNISHRNGCLLTMPGLNEKSNALSCKLVTSFLDNPGKFNLPSILANIFLFDPSTGKLKAILEGTTITEWRTAAASVAATRALRPNTSEHQTLAVFGAGKQGRIHIIAFHHFFKFKKINLWNRTARKGEELAKELKKDYKIDVNVFTDVETCAKEADVIITATYTSTPFLKCSDVKPNALINAIGAGIHHHCELDKDIYEKSSIYTDSIDNARVELKGLIKDGYQVLGEIGEVMNGTKTSTEDGIAIFHSLGMATEDGVAAELVLECYLKKERASMTSI